MTSDLIYYMRQKRKEQERLKGKEGIEVTQSDGSLLFDDRPKKKLKNVMDW